LIPVHRSSSRKGLPFRWVALVFVGVLSIGLALGFAVYRTYVAYEPTTAHHVPPDATLVARFDLTHVMLYEPFRRSIFPLVDTGPGGAGRRERLSTRGIRVGSDVREVLLALGPQPRQWLLAVGGRLPRSQVDLVLASVLREEGRLIDVRSGVYLLPETGVAFAQAADGTLLIASSEPRLRSALAHRSVTLPIAGASGGFWIAGSWLGDPPPVSSLDGQLRAGSVVEVKANVRVQSKPADAQAAARALLERFAALDPALAEAARTAQIEPSEVGAAARLRLPRPAVERLAALAATRAADGNMP
jgi:hypothetical protein